MQVHQLPKHKEIQATRSKGAGEAANRRMRTRPLQVLAQLCRRGCWGGFRARPQPCGPGQVP